MSTKGHINTDLKPDHIRLSKRIPLTTFQNSISEPDTSVNDILLRHYNNNRMKLYSPAANHLEVLTTDVNQEGIPYSICLLEAPGTFNWAAVCCPNPNDGLNWFLPRCGNTLHADKQIPLTKADLIIVTSTRFYLHDPRAKRLLQEHPELLGYANNNQLGKHLTLCLEVYAKLYGFEGLNFSQPASFPDTDFDVLINLVEPDISRIQKTANQCLRDTEDYREYCLKQHKELWTTIAEKTKVNNDCYTKTQYFMEHTHLPMPLNLCFACDFAKYRMQAEYGDKASYSKCVYCPLYWPNLDANGVPCCCTDPGLYEQWTNAVEEDEDVTLAANLAEKIANVPPKSRK